MARILPRDRVIHEGNIVQGGIVMIRVGIIGASGMAGSAIYKLASTKKLELFEMRVRPERSLVMMPI